MVLAAEPVVTHRLFTVEEFHRLADVGVFRPDERLELFEGVVVQMSPIGDPHAGATNGAVYLLNGLIGKGAIIAVQNPLRLGGASELYPDIAVLRYRADFYRERTASESDALLLIEVSDTTVRYDLETKAALYAAHGVAEYWVEDLNGGRLVVHRDPTQEGYRSVQTLTRRDRVRPLAFPDVEIVVSDLLG